MFTKPIKHIFTKQAFKTAFDDISSKAVGLDEMSFEDFKKGLSSNIDTLINSIKQGTYAPEPIKKIEIDKPNSDKKRPIGLSSIKDKLVQRVLYIGLQEYFDKNFSSNSYAYRKNKSSTKAVNRTSDYIKQKFYWVLKTDIDNFFECINHDKLLQILDKQISNKSIIRLISLFLQTGGFKKFDYFEHLQGVHQGDILSPLLSNIYLDLMDKFLEKNEVAFVRYADDFVVLARGEKEIKGLKKMLQNFLKALDLKLNREKTYILHVKEGFSFLGVRFRGKNKEVDNERFQKLISKLTQKSKTNVKFLTFIEDINNFLNALENYYLKIIQKNSTQHHLLQEYFLQTISHKIYLEKTNKRVSTKKEFKAFLQKVNFAALFNENEIKDKTNLTIAMAYEKYLANKTYKASKTNIDKKKNLYAKKFANDTTLHVDSFGLSVGINKNKFSIKKYGKVQKYVPMEKVKRIILEGKGISLSSNIIKLCAKKEICIDFISKDLLPYASLITYKASMTQMIYKQAHILNTPLQLYLAKGFIKGKAKNQINYLKYLNKYHNLLDSHIEKMQNILSLQVKKANSNEQLMGYEGSISAIYWDGIKTILNTPFEKRVTYQARDTVNSSLNYAYAILYGKVQYSLVQAGLSLSISFLHALDKQKPTLTFDMIEEFRTFIVDRTIVSMLNKDEPIKLGKDGLLTKPSRKLIAKNIKEKLGSYTMWKKQSQKCENIIQIQCYKLAKSIQDFNQSYKPFIGKY